MDWIAISAISEVLGLLILIISVIYLAAEVRQANSLAASESLKDSVKVWTDHQYKAFGTKENADLSVRALNDFSSLETA